ncbi:TonB-dependent receptor [Plebeiibacterium marinum]|uniref:TonB-dependent receptor n=1 Tax=Plebeiibacterium marinum TaxID=2992111 RepID=A0AAE3SLE1_9BACT|nr:TonB-dependent receptor [Plebeiobacterium marinum]MCW3807607.1 TonB-dependent receptor [Plebeiobacterium marinum]
MKYNNIYIIIALLFVSFTTVKAQELNQDVKVVREYNPIISDAFKINKLPVSEVDSMTFNPRFSYNVLSKAMTSGLAIEPITAAKLKPERKTVLDKSYIKGGLGNYVTLFGDLNYNVLRSEEYALGLNIGHVTSDGDIKLEDDSKSEAPIHDTWASLYFRRFWDDYTLSVDAEFDHNIYNYYGFHTVGAATSYLYDENDLTASALGADLIPDRKQRLSSFGLNIGFGNKVVDSDDVSFKANLKWETFSNITEVSENVIGLNALSRVYFDDVFLDIAGGFDFYGTSVPVSGSPLYSFEDRSMTILNLSPALGFVFEGIDFKVGLDSYSQLGGDGGFNIAPHLEANLIIADGIVSAFGGVCGDYYTNNYQKMQSENMFIAPDVNVENSFHGLHFFGGIKGNFSSQTSFVARVDYSVFDDEHFYVNKSFEDSANPGVFSQSNLFTAQYDDGTLLSLSGELKYEPSSKANVLLKGKYNGWSLNTLDEAWHKPEVEIGLTANYSPFEDLWVNLGVYSMGKRKALDVSTGGVKELKSVVDINLGAQYTISSKWNIFASLNNAIVSKYYQWNGYPMQGMNIRAGVGYSF